MAGDVRQRMVLSALYLIAERGVQGTSIADVLERSGAPRGSVYHHFPGGKDEIVGAAMEYMATDARAPLRALRGSDVAGIVTGFTNLWRGVLTTSLRNCLKPLALTDRRRPTSRGCSSPRPKEHSSSLARNTACGPLTSWSSSSSASARRWSDPAPAANRLLTSAHTELGRSGTRQKRAFDRGPVSAQPGCCHS